MPGTRKSSGSAGKKPASRAKPPATPSARPKKAAAATTTAAAKKSPVAKKTKAGSAKPGTKSPAKKIPAYKLKRYRCRLCGYVYSPLRGEPHNGIPAGTPFEDLPEDYVCPVCGYEGRGKIGKWGFDEWAPTRYICSICGYVYDEKRGEPHRGIKPGTKFDDLPDDYKCPVCAQDPKINVQFGKVLKQGFEPLYTG
jgi:rubredoxin